MNPQHAGEQTRSGKAWTKNKPSIVTSTRIFCRYLPDRATFIFTLCAASDKTIFRTPILIRDSSVLLPAVLDENPELDGSGIG
jgi:hypothetical protein